MSVDVLFTEDKASLKAETRLFEEHMEPLLQKLEAYDQLKVIGARLPEIPQYLRVCRWPFRKLEYTYALDALLGHLRPGDRFLDAGSGVTPFAHALSARGIQADACDYDGRLIGELKHFAPEHIYGSAVTYTQQDLTAITYPDEMFDAISCISVLEHIPAPSDQRAIDELLRVLKPGGLLILTVDFTPTSADTISRLTYYGQRAIALARGGNISEIRRGITRKLQAQQAISTGAARAARSANQCFESVHLEQDLQSRMEGQEIARRLPFVRPLHSVTSVQARQFWELEAGLFDDQGRRTVLPAAHTLRKIAVAVGA
jgi:ubiquinone/menaquinone biosynthesis C-methylase UbiE